MILLAQIAQDAPIGPYVTGGVVLAVSGALTYFVKRSFEEFGSLLKEAVAVVQGHTVTIATQDLKIAHLEARVLKLETRYESEGR